MFEKLRQFLDDGKSMLQDAFVVPDDKDFIAVPPGVTEEQLIEEAKQYVDAIIVPRRDGHHQNLVGVEMDTDTEPNPLDSGKQPADSAPDQNLPPDDSALNQNLSPDDSAPEQNLSPDDSIEQ